MYAQRFVAAIFCLILFLSSEARSQFVFNRVAITGEPTTIYLGLDPQTRTFDSLYGPIIDRDGNVILEGTILTQDGLKDGILYHRRSTSQLNVRGMQDAQVPFLINGTRPNAFFGSIDGRPTFGPLKLDTGTEYTFRAHLKGGDTTPIDDTAAFRSGFWVVREGEAFDGNRRVGDQFAFEGLAQETVRRPFPLLDTPLSTDTAFPMADLARLAEGTQTTQGFLGDVRDARPLLVPHSLNVAFRGTSTGAGGSEVPNNQRIYFQLFSNNVEHPRVLARQGDFITGAGRMESFNHPATGLFGRDTALIFFGVRLSGPEVIASNDSAIAVAVLSGTSPSVSLREGTQLFDAAPGTVLGDLATDNIVGGEQGTLIFNNQLQGPAITATNDWALITSKDSSRILAQEGQHVDGLPTGSVLTGLDAPHFQLNLVGEAIFNAEFAGPNGNGLGLFYARIDQSEPRLIVRTGQDFDIGGGVFKTISDIGLMEISSSWDGRGSQINDAGQITFSLTFTDGSKGVFTAIPEPATAALALIGVMVAMALHRRSKKRPVTF